MTAGHVLHSEWDIASNYEQRQSAASSRERPLPRNHSQSSTEVSVDFREPYSLMRYAYSRPVSRTDERMDGGEKKDVGFLPLVPLELYHTVSYLFPEPQCSPGKHDHMFQLR